MTLASKSALRVVTLCGAMLSYGSAAWATCTYAGSPAPYVRCIYDEVLDNAADILGLSARLGSAEADIAALESTVAAMDSYYTRTSTFRVSPGYYAIVTASCDGGDLAISGGFELAGNYAPGMAGEHIIGSSMNPSRTGWKVTLYNDTHNTGWNVDIDLVTQVVCLNR